MSSVTVNGRDYRLPGRPVVVVCADGCDPLYFERALADGAMPALPRLRGSGSYRLARSAMPSFTNPHHLSLVTGVPPSVPRVCGTSFYDPTRRGQVLTGH